MFGPETSCLVFIPYAWWFTSRNWKIISINFLTFYSGVTSAVLMLPLTDTSPEAENATSSLSEYGQVTVAD